MRQQKQQITSSKNGINLHLICEATGQPYATWLFDSHQLCLFLNDIGKMYC